MLFSGIWRSSVFAGHNHHYLLGFVVIVCLLKQCDCFQCYQYMVRNKVSPDLDDIKKPVDCEGLTKLACVKLITRNSMKGLAEEADKAFTTEGRCALYDDECPSSKVDKCFDEAPRNLFGIIQKVTKCCSTKELSNSAPESSHRYIVVVVVVVIPLLVTLSMLINASFYGAIL